MSLERTYVDFLEDMKSSPQEVVEFVKLLNATRILEAQQIAFEVLDKHKAARQSLTLVD